jgi:hypothetical protein
MKNLLLFTALILASNAVNAQSWSLSGNAGTTASQYLGTSDNLDLRIKTNNSTRLTVGATGKLGINTSIDTKYRLLVADQLPLATSQNLIYGSVTGRFSNSTGTLAANGYLGAFCNATLGIGTFPTGLKYVGVLGVKEDDSSVGAGVMGWNKNTNAGNIHYGVYGMATGISSGVAALTDRNIGVYGSAMGSYKNIGVYGNASGAGDWAAYFKGRGYYSDRLGVGIEEPSSMLHVNTGSGTSPFRISVNSTTKVLVNSSGNMGIGTQSPGVKLHLNGTGELLRLNATAPSMTFHNSNVAKAFMQCDQGNLNLGLSANNTSGNMYFYANNVVRMSMMNNGNFGLGTASPTAKLQIHTNAEAIGLRGADAFLQFYNNSNVAVSFIQSTTADLKIGTATGNTTGDLIFRTNAGDALRINEDGDVMIGTGTPASGYMLSVAGKVMCEELRVRLENSWPDYVFSDNYPLMSIDELAKNVEENHHLPGLPSASQIEEQGSYHVGEMQQKLLEKVEELTLYIIQLNDSNKALKAELDALKKN